ncbi:hypothetical protein ULF88_05485 [Halopseudomonas pachastrellae]|nr:hypothetical protein [Halopseudomonas pachastrellae]
MPLFSGRRNRGEVQAALAARNEIQYRREDTLLRLRHSSSMPGRGGNRPLPLCSRSAKGWCRI